VTTIRLAPGDVAPWFHARSTSNPRYAFNSVAGRYVVLLFHGIASHPLSQQALAAVAANRSLFDDDRACLFGVSVDPGDEAEGRVVESLPGIRHFFDIDLSISRSFGFVVDEPGKAPALRPGWVVLDPTLRVVGLFPINAHEDVFRLVETLPPPALHAGVEMHAPVLIVPRVFEPELCRYLISLYEQHGGEDSGFMREVDGKTVAVVDHRHKRRSDYDITDEALKKAIAARIERRLRPMIQRAFQFDATRMERYIVACYDATSGGHFRAHRDNTTKGTAHRRFAVTINLNAEEYEGGDLRFPEFGDRTYRAPTGGAVVFSCSLLHEAQRVTRGQRYAFLPFLYDDAAAAVREANNPYLGDGVGEYRRDTVGSAHTK
jgi:predicted 2-oxoglutarate/Fe(II)-dependent dioxygenase YbiX/peroxiredoxin